jgi:hypothetical protein
MPTRLPFLPRRFVLCVDGGEGALEAGDLVAWGFEFKRVALVFACHPSGLQYDLWVFTSVNEARQVLSRYGEIRVLWTAQPLRGLIPEQRSAPPAEC